ncbi:MAG TPA: hypothetical protein ENI99_09560 [Sedimenticola sp.]|nr:hypothetical protein [Sedimenticola sp.]
MKILVFVLSFLMTGILCADESTACLLKYYDEYTANRLALFEQAGIVYKAKYARKYKVYAPVLESHALFAKVNRYVFHYLVKNDIGRLKLRHGFTNSVPPWIRDACTGKKCINALYVELTRFPEFVELYSRWEKAEERSAAAYKDSGITQAGKIYLNLLGEESVLPYAIKDMSYYGLKVTQLICE